MKNICHLLTGFLLNAVSAQDFDGVYLGRIVSEKNVLVVSTTAGTAVGAIHLNKAEKITFVGAIVNGTLSGTFRHGDNSWSLAGKIKNDSPILQLISAKERFSTSLKKLSASTSFKFSKLLDEAPPHDIRLVGTWRPLYVIDQGVIKRIDNKMVKGATYQFNMNGTCRFRSSDTDKLLKESKSVPLCYWETRGDMLIMTMQSRNGSGTLEGDYLIKGDTLIITYKGSDSYFLRSGK